MADYPEITFNYFDLRGRGQFIRAMLEFHGVPYEDNRIVLSKDNSNWPEIRNDRLVTGDFQKVPFLQWGEFRLNETLVILEFLDKQLGPNDLNDTAWLQHRQLTSSAFLDLVVACINLIWSDIFHPGTNVPATTAILKRRIAMHLATLNQTLTEWQWLDGLQDRPVMASDAVLWEGLDMIRLTFDDHVSFEELDVLAAFYDESPGASTFKKLLAEKHLNITGRPSEPDALAAIHGSLNDGI
jgi:glutathione S-transferase